MMWRERGRRIGEWRVPLVPAVHDASPERDDQDANDRKPPLQAAGRADSEVLRKSDDPLPYVDLNAVSVEYWSS
jgi:hypothetical protein